MWSDVSRSWRKRRALFSSNFSISGSMAACALGYPIHHSTIGCSTSPMQLRAGNEQENARQNANQDMCIQKTGWKYACFFCVYSIWIICSPLRIICSPLRIFRSPLRIFRSLLRTFHSPSGTFRSPSRTFHSPLRTFRSPSGPESPVFKGFFPSENKYKTRVKQE